MSQDSFSDDFSQVRDTLAPLLGEVEEIIATGSNYVHAYHSLSDRLGSDWPKRRFYAAAADPDSPLGMAIARGRARFQIELSRILRQQASEGVATAPRLLADQATQNDINAAMKRFFPEL